jgi:hypothetical protein
MPDPKRIHSQIEKLTADLIGASLCNEQRFPVIKEQPDGLIDVNFGNVTNLSIVLRNRPYKDVYDELERNKSYNLKMLDGAILQIMYRFRNSEIESHRLAFFPSPYLEEFQNNPEIYETDEIYADIIMKNIVPFPIRFDFDSREDVHKVLEHPKSHLTLGQYRNCRIPVSAPLTPYCFISFILRNFYHTAYQKFCEIITPFTDVFSDTIDGLEKRLVHISVPLSGEKWKLSR